MPPPPSATYQRLRETIAERMRMSPIYQPLMLMELLARRSPAPPQDIAHRILGSAWWAGFTFNGITAYGDGHDSLIGGDALSDGERDVLVSSAASASMPSASSAARRCLPTAAATAPQSAAQ